MEINKVVLHNTYQPKALCHVTFRPKTSMKCKWIKMVIHNIHHPKAGGITFCPKTCGPPNIVKVVLKHAKSHQHVVSTPTLCFIVKLPLLNSVKTFHYIEKLLEIPTSFMVSCLLCDDIWNGNLASSKTRYFTSSSIIQAFYMKNFSGRVISTWFIITDILLV